MRSQFEQDIPRFKIIIIGKAAVGKSTILIRYVDDLFLDQQPTIGIDYRFKTIYIENQKFKMELWDTAAQQRYRTIVLNYFGLSKAACVVFDITDEHSLQQTKMWLKQLVLHCGNQIPKILLGNKIDKVSQSQLKDILKKYQLEINQLRQQYQVQFFPVSALTGENIRQAFRYLEKQLFSKHLQSINNPIVNNNQKSIKLNKRSLILFEKQKRQKKCCQ